MLNFRLDTPYQNADSALQFYWTVEKISDDRIEIYFVFMCPYCVSIPSQDAMKIEGKLPGSDRFEERILIPP